MSEDKVRDYLAEGERRIGDEHIRAIREIWGTAFQRADAPAKRETIEFLCDDLLDARERLPRYRRAIEAAQALHRPYGLYDKCGHDHGEEGEGEGIVQVYEIGLTCKKMYDICWECCTDDADQTEECVSYHKHGPNLPICKTAEAIARALLGEEGE